MSNEDHYGNMLFNNETTHRTDYRDGNIEPITTTVYKEKPLCRRVRPPPLKYSHTLDEWKDARVPPFNLLHKPKEIVRTNPSDVQLPYEKSIDEDLEHVVKTRPRVFMMPAVSLDDVPPKERGVLMGEIYASTTQRTHSQAVVLGCVKPSVKAPLPLMPAPANPITLTKLVPPYVSPEWRLESVAWDRNQLRAYCDPGREFYLHRKPR